MKFDLLQMIPEVQSRQRIQFYDGLQRSGFELFDSSQVYFSPYSSKASPRAFNQKIIFKDPYMLSQQNEAIPKDLRISKGYYMKSSFYDQLQISRKTMEKQLIKIVQQSRNQIYQQQPKHSTKILQPSLNEKNNCSFNRIQGLIKIAKQIKKSRVSEDLCKQNQRRTANIISNDNLRYKFAQKLDNHKELQQKMAEDRAKRQQLIEYHKQLNRFQQQSYKNNKTIKHRFDHFQHLFTSILWIDKQLLNILNVFPLQFKQLMLDISSYLQREQVILAKFINDLIPTQKKQIKSKFKINQWKGYAKKLLQKSNYQWQKRHSIAQYQRQLRQLEPLKIIRVVRQLASAKRIPVQIRQLEILQYRVTLDKLKINK